MVVLPIGGRDGDEGQVVKVGSGAGYCCYFARYNYNISLSPQHTYK